jgi:hypothetical protein
MDRRSLQWVLATLSDYVNSWKLESLFWGIVPFLLCSLSWVAAAVALYTLMRSVLGSYLGYSIGYPDIQWFYSALPGECWDITSIRRPVPSGFDSAHHSFTIIPFDSTSG